MIEKLNYLTTDIIGDSVDSLVLKGIDYVRAHGDRLDARAGTGIQAYNVNYTLTNPYNRIHALRAPTSIGYLARELLVYFQGTLDAKDMASAAKFWLSIQDEDGKINSNYGYYVFHHTVPDGRTQYEWVLDVLDKKPKSRRPIININQPHHKTGTKDMPCTIAMQFFVQDNHLCSVISSRSTDVITGLPYDQGFFSFVLELAHKDLIERGHTDLQLGYCMMKTTFTQLYDSRKPLEAKIQAKRNQEIQRIEMPRISFAKVVLDDISNGTAHSEIIQWCQENG